MKETISVRVHVKLSDIEDLLYSCATGSNYWSNNADQLGYESFVKEAFEKSVWIADSEEDKLHTFNLKKIKKGLTIMAKKEPKHFADFMSENSDEVTADVFLQCCLFGQVIYG